jgi:hypothetical protein
LPISQDYFEDDGKKSKYLDENFDSLWHNNLGVKGLRQRIEELESSLIKTDAVAEDLKSVLISKDVIQEADLTTETIKLNSKRVVK